MRILFDPIQLQFDFKSGQVLDNSILKRVELSILLFDSIRLVARSRNKLNKYCYYNKIRMFIILIFE